MKNIPVLTTQGLTLAESYEKALINLYNNGTRFKTQYDKPGDPLSIDCTANITILEPETDPMIHMAFPGGIEELLPRVQPGRPQLRLARAHRHHRPGSNALRPARGGL